MITERCMWTHLERVRTKPLLTTFYDFLVRHFKTKNSSRDENTQTWRDVSCKLFIYSRLSIDSQWTGNSIDIQLNLNLSSHRKVYSTVMCGLWIFAAWLPIYHLPGNVISATVGFVCINLYQNMRFPDPLVSNNVRSSEKLELGHCPPQPLPKEKTFCTGVWVLVYNYLRVRFDLPSSIAFRDINGFPKWGLEPLLWVTLEGPKWGSLDSLGMIFY